MILFVPCLELRKKEFLLIRSKSLHKCHEPLYLFVLPILGNGGGLFFLVCNSQKIVYRTVKPGSKL